MDNTGTRRLYHFLGAANSVEHEPAPTTSTFPNVRAASGEVAQNSLPPVVTPAVVVKGSSKYNGPRCRGYELYPMSTRIAPNGERTRTPNPGVYCKFPNPNRNESLRFHTCPASTKTLS